MNTKHEYPETLWAQVGGGLDARCKGGEAELGV